ncbi:MAG TPA: hypothetical protein PK466_08340 [Thermotogota bacterium]|nr:hypothetical protein [Thermotogota bacterium]
MIFILLIIASGVLISKEIKINYVFDNGDLKLTEELMVSSSIHYKDYEMYVVFKKGELTYSTDVKKTNGLLKAVELIPVAVIRVKKDNPHIGHDSYSIKMINETDGIERLDELMTIAEKLCLGKSVSKSISLNFELSEIIMILQILELL